MKRRRNSCTYLEEVLSRQTKKDIDLAEGFLYLRKSMKGGQCAWSRVSEDWKSGSYLESF